MEPAPSFSSGGLSVEEAILGIDWSATQLGHPSAWPQSLRSIVALILASGKPMFIVWGPARTFLYNDAYVSLLGPKHPAALGEPFFSVWPDSHGELAPIFDRLFGGTVIDIDDISISFDRDEEGCPQALFALSYTPIRDHGNAVVGLLCIYSETTDHVPGKASRPNDHKRLARLFDQAPSFIAVLNGPEHRIELANAGLVNLLGERNIGGRTVEEVLPEPMVRDYLVLLDHAFETGEQVVRTGVRYVVKGSGGAEDERFADFLFQPIIDGIGQVTGIFVHGSDVTDRMHDQTLLRDRETHLHEQNADLGRLITERSAQLLAKEALIQTVYEHSSEYHVVVAQIRADAFRLEEINPAALKLYKAARADVIGRTIDECLSAGEAATANAHLNACLAADAPHPFEFGYRGNIIEGIASPLPPLRGSGRQIAVSGRDVTERRNLEEQLRHSQKMEAVGQLTGGLAHDFNNLLSGISGSLELLGTRKAQGRVDEMDRYIVAAQGAAQRAAALTRRLLTFARRQNLDARSTDVNRLVAGMAELVRRTVGPTIEVAIIAAADLWETRVDPNQLENALLNLCINARDAMPTGGNLVIETGNHVFDERSTSEHDMIAGEYLSLSVSDTGTGMSPDVMARAFEPFFTTKPLGGGTGLGLSMLYGFARQSGGRVRIDSELGHGTKVHVYLPRHVGGADPVEPPMNAAKPLRIGRGETVLVVDDEPTVRMVVTEVLNDLGYEAIEAKDGLEALKVLQSNERIDLLVTDIGLPGGIEGRQVGDSARACRPGIPILYITGYAYLPEAGVAPADPRVQILAKPFEMQELAVRINALMGQGEPPI